MPRATSSARPFGAVLTAMVTPMTAHGELDLDSAVRLATHLVDNGHDGLVLNGTTGEAPTTHAPEKAALIGAVVGAVGERAWVVAGAGSNDTAHAVRMAEQAAAAGAHGLLVVSPYYSRPSQEGVYRHIRSVVDSTDLPVMLYDVPGRSGVRIAPATVARLAEHAAHGPAAGLVPDRAMLHFAVQADDGGLAVHLDILLAAQRVDEFGRQQRAQGAQFGHEGHEVRLVAAGIRVANDGAGGRQLQRPFGRRTVLVEGGLDNEATFADIDQRHAGSS